MRERSRSRFAAVAVAVLCGTLALAGCGTQDSAGAEGNAGSDKQEKFGLKGDPIKIGVAEPITGPSAGFGVDQVTATVWAANQINKEGGINGRPIELKIIDTKADPQLGIAAVKRFTDLEKTPAFIAGFSNVVSAVAPIADRSKTLALSVGANAPTIAKLGEYTYTTFPLADVDLTALAQYTHGTLKKVNAAVMYINNDTGKYGAEVYRDAFEEAGGTVVAFEAYQPTDSNFAGQIARVKAENPDIVHIQGLIDDLPQVIAQLRQAGVNAQISTYSAGYNPELIDKLGDAAEGLIVTNLAPTVESSPAVADYVRRWEDDKGREPNGLPYTMYFYDAVYVVKNVVQHVLDAGQDLTGTNLAKALVDIGQMNLPLTGDITFNADHTVSKPVYLMQVKDSKFEQIAEIK